MVIQKNVIQICIPAPKRMMDIIDKKGNKFLTVFANHLKSKLGGEEGTSEKRIRQSTRVAEIIQERFGNDKNASFAVLGDFNYSPDAQCHKPSLDEMKLENFVSIFFYPGLFQRRVMRFL